MYVFIYKAYVGQSTGTLKKRNQEHAKLRKKKHKKKLLQSTKKNDGVAYHHHLTGHQIDFPNTTIIAQETSYWRGLIIEGINIRKLGENTANLQAGFEINVERLISEHESWFSRTFAGVEFGFLLRKTTKIQNENTS